MTGIKILFCVLSLLFQVIAHKVTTAPGKPIFQSRSTISLVTFVHSTISAQQVLTCHNPVLSVTTPMQQECGSASYVWPATYVNQRIPLFFALKVIGSILVETLKRRRNRQQYLLLQNFIKFPCLCPHGNLKHVGRKYV